jgi:hypothetical protein
MESEQKQETVETAFPQGASPSLVSLYLHAAAALAAPVEHDDRSNEGLAEARGQRHLQCGGMRGAVMVA